jgi:hypothetical protein
MYEVGPARGRHNSSSASTSIMVISSNCDTAEAAMLLDTAQARQLKTQQLFLADFAQRTL